MIRPVEPFDESKPLLKEAKKRAEALPPLESETVGALPLDLGFLCDLLLGRYIEYRRYASQMKRYTYVLTDRHLMRYGSAINEKLRAQVREEHGEEAVILNDIELPIGRDLPEPVEEAA